jgi:hypothetical protein
MAAFAFLQPILDCARFSVRLMDFHCSFSGIALRVG